MPYCELTSYRFAVRVEYEAGRDVGANRTAVRVRRVEVRTLWTDRGSCWMIGTVKVNGTTAVNMILDNVYACAFTLGADYDGCGESSQGFTATEVLIPHNPDGTAADAVFAIDLKIRVTGGKVLEPSISGTVKVPLERIPRVSAIQAEAVELGQPMNIRLSRSAPEFRDALSWQCGGQSGEIAPPGEETELTFTPPLTLAREAPDSVTVPVKLRVTTYAGQTPIGTGEITLDCRVPEQVTPRVSITVTDAMGYAPNHGGYIQGRSQARVRSFPTGIYGSTIREVAVTCGSSTASGDDVTFALPAVGRQAITVTVTDSRGRQAKATYYIQVLPYSPPTAVIGRVFRCDAEGQEQADGAWAAIEFTGSAAEIRNNAVSYQLLRRIRGGETLPPVPLTAYDDRLTVTDGRVVLPAGPDSSYDCRIRVEDSFAAGESLLFTIPVAFVLLDLHRNGRALGLGMRARSENTLSIGLVTDMDSHRITNLPDPVEGTDAATVDYVNQKIRELAALVGVEFE